MKHLTDINKDCIIYQIWQTMSRHCRRNCDVLVNEYAKNRQMFLAVLQNKQFLTRQGLEIRGNKGQGNFDPVTKLSSKTDAKISWWINQKVDRKKKTKQVFT